MRLSVASLRMALLFVVPLFEGDRQRRRRGRGLEEVGERSGFLHYPFDYAQGSVEMTGFGVRGRRTRFGGWSGWLQSGEDDDEDEDAE